MGLFSGVLDAKAMTSKQLEDLILSTHGGNKTVSGIAVNTDSAMRASTVYSCVSVLERAISIVPCSIIKQIDKNREVAEDFYLHPLVHDMPNAWMTAPEFWGMAVSHLALKGNFYCLKSGLEGREIKELIPLQPGAVTKIEQTKDYKLFYTVKRPDGTGEDIIPGDRIMHVRGLTLNGINGLSVIQYQRERMGIELATEKYGAKLFANGAMMGGVLKNPGSFIDEEDAKKAVANFNSAYASVENAHKTVLLQHGLTWEKASMTAEDARFIDAMKFTRSVIAGFFGIPAHLINDLEKATFSNIEHLGISFVTYGLLHYLVKIEKAIFRDLLIPRDRKTKYAKFNVNSLLRGAFADRMKGYQTAINTEIMSPNEAREKEDLNPYEGGDEYRTRTSTVKGPEENTGEKK